MLKEVFIIWTYSGDAPAHFVYRLSGGNSQTQAVISGSLHQLHFKLPPGLYHFELKAASGAGANSGTITQDFQVN